METITRVHIYRIFDARLSVSLLAESTLFSAGEHDAPNGPDDQSPFSVQAEANCFAIGITVFVTQGFSMDMTYFLVLCALLLYRLIHISDAPVLMTNVISSCIRIYDWKSNFDAVTGAIPPRKFSSHRKHCDLMRISQRLV